MINMCKSKFQVTKEIGPGGMAGVVVDVMEDLTDGSGSVTISAIILKKEILKQVSSLSVTT